MSFKTLINESESKLETSLAGIKVLYKKLEAVDNEWSDKLNKALKGLHSEL